MKKFNIKSLLASAMIAASLCTTTCAAPMGASASIHLDFWNRYYNDVTVIYSQYTINGRAVDGYAVTAYNDDYLWTGSISSWFLKDMLGVNSLGSYGTKTKDIRADYLDDSAFTCSCLHY